MGLYSAENYPEVPCYLTLLKLDPSDVFRPKTQSDAQGKLYVGFEVTSDAMPTTRERLQKCVFIQPLDPRSEYDMMLLDRQSQERETVAQFFSEKFLGAKLALDNQIRTERLYRSLIASQNQLRPHLSEKENNNFAQAINYVVNSQKVSIDDFLETLPLKEEHKNQVNQTISKNLPDRRFSIDKNVAEKLVKKRRFTGDYGLKLEIRSSEYDQIVESVERTDGEEGQPAYYRVTLRTEKWKEVP